MFGDRNRQEESGNHQIMGSTKSNVTVGNVFMETRRLSTMVVSHGLSVRTSGIEYVSNWTNTKMERLRLGLMDRILNTSRELQLLIQFRGARNSLDQIDVTIQPHTASECHTDSQRLY